MCNMFWFHRCVLWSYHRWRSVKCVVLWHPWFWLWWFVVFKFTVVATLNILLLTVVIVLCMYAYNAIFSVMVMVDAQLCILKLARLVSQPLLFCWFWYFVIFKCILAYILPLQWQDKAKMHLNIALHWLWWSCYVCKYVFILLVMEKSACSLNSWVATLYLLSLCFCFCISWGSSQERQLKSRPAVEDLLGCRGGTITSGCKYYQC